MHQRSCVCDVGHVRMCPLSTRHDCVSEVENTRNPRRHMAFRSPTFSCSEGDRSRKESGAGGLMSVRVLCTSVSFAIAVFAVACSGGSKRSGFDESNATDPNLPSNGGQGSGFGPNGGGKGNTSCDLNNTGDPN